MTQNTRAERLRKLIADEDEDNDFQNAVIASSLASNTFSALKVFVTALHEHETSRRYRLHESTRCLMCLTADNMIKEFS